MDRYQSTFARLKKENQIGFCPFAVLGDPTPQQCLVRIKKYVEARPDFLELGIPFSDPIADGAVIQAADERALKAGTTPRVALNLIKKIRALAGPTMPIGILTYSNIVLRFGIEKFYLELKRAGADSILIADVPLEEIAPFARAARTQKIHQIFLVSEYTDAARLKKIAHYASGFLYVVSTLGVTGTRTSLSNQITPLLKRLKRETDLPLVVGFGISHSQHIKQLKHAGADGAIVGSALVKTPTKKLSRLLFSFLSTTFG